MPFITLLDTKLLAAVATTKRPQPCVDPLVLQESIFGLEVLLTYKAKEGLGIGVDPLMADHVTVLTEGATTHLGGRGEECQVVLPSV